MINFFWGVRIWSSGFAPGTLRWLGSLFLSAEEFCFWLESLFDTELELELLSLDSFALENEASKSTFFMNSTLFFFFSGTFSRPLVVTVLAFGFSMLSFLRRLSL